MSTLKIESNGIEMEWCCEHMENLIRRKSAFKLDHINGQGGLFVSLTSLIVDKINYCPYCGEKINITNDAHDTMLYKGSPARRPAHWENL